ncbi:MAG: type II toxin-antitoxin system RelE/ParE family toxin [Methanomassiliicoccales archaeon]|nr:MAG: type II toxin-antitoxin system RelE/ParE family toxin [Methanomassiliicoccales archaeon]
MTYEVLLSATSVRQLRKLPNKERDRIAKALRKLEEDPFSPRSGADSRALEGTKPEKHSLRVGPYRVIYPVMKKKVKVVEVFRRGRGYK